MKTLLLDIETSPNLAYVWQKWETNVIQFKSEWEILSIAYKWLDKGTIFAKSQKDMTEKELVQEIWELLDEADIVVAHNGDQFDLKKIRAKFLEYRLTPPSPYKQVDTKKIAKSAAAFNSNSLDDLGATLNLGRKGKTGGFDTWLGCMANDPAAWAQMIKYNKQDVALLEKVYLRLRPYATSHPVVSQVGCPTCASLNTKKAGVLITRTVKKQTHKCNDCGRRFTEGRVK